jgi:hypothetical protein
LVLASSLLKKEDSLEWSNPKSNGGPMESWKITMWRYVTQNTWKQLISIGGGSIYPELFTLVFLLFVNRVVGKYSLKMGKHRGHRQFGPRSSELSVSRKAIVRWVHVSELMPYPIKSIWTLLPI